MSLYGVTWLDRVDSNVSFAAPPTQDMCCAQCVVQRNSRDCQRCTGADGWYVLDDDDYDPDFH
jgi:hypothetical protein